MDRSAIERQHSAAIRRHADASAAESAAESHPLLQLQRQVGNAQIARMLAQRQAPEEEEIQASRLQREGEEDEMVQAARLQRHEEGDGQIQMQRDLAQREGEDEDEIQASRLQREGEDEDEIQASRLQREGEEEDEIQASRLQREGADEDELQMTRDTAQREGEEEDEIAMSRDLQREPEVGLDGGPVSSGLADRINAQRGGGSSLDDGMRSNMESSFGADFSDVRVHSSGESASLNRSIAGKAFTTGSDIFLGESASASDSSLMAHELTHVVQQREMTGGGGPMTVTAAGDMHEQEADATAAAVTSGAPAPGAAQRKADEQR
jgi:hypothetical protein